MAVAPWFVPDGLWTMFESLLPMRERRFRYPGRKRLDDRAALQGILFVLHTGIAWRHLPLELGFGSGSTCYRRLCEWQEAGVWQKLHALLLAELRAAGARPGRPPAKTSRTRARRSRLRPRQVPPRAAAALHHAGDRTSPHRTRLRPRPLPLGRRAHLRLATSLQAAARPLRPPSRDPRSLPRARLLPRLLQEAPALIVIRVLSGKYEDFEEAYMN